MKLVVAAHDAGGANAIAPVVAHFIARGDTVTGMLGGPALDIFRARDIQFTDDMHDSDAFLFGTSMGETVEKNIFTQLNGRIPSIAVLDFWSNYAERFSSPRTKDLKFLPSRICVMDDIAKDEMIVEGFPRDRIVVTGNPHFDHFADNITRDGGERGRILFVSQPLPGDKEFAALKDMIDVLPKDYRLVIRLHPKEALGKYDSYLSSSITIAGEPTLEEALSRSGLIVGMVSLVLLQAAAAGKRVISYEAGLDGPDPLVSNRVGVTHRAGNKQALAAEFANYIASKPAPRGEDFRKFWPAGATERVVAAVLALAEEK